MSADTFDLNDPYDARSYVGLWVSNGALMLSVSITEMSDETALELARRLFMEVDEEHPAMGFTQ